MKLRFSTLAALALSLWLSACATISIEPLPEGLTNQPPSDWSQRQLQLQALQHWQLQGKLAVRQPSDSGSAVINYWTQHQEAFELSLSSSFLGLGTTELKGVPGFISLTLPDGETYQSGDPEGLVQAATGWQLPITSLPWWIRGLPSPASDYNLFFDADQKVAMIRQDGWEIRYDRWNQFMADKPELPARITAVKGEKRVRLAVTHWQPLGAEPSL
ncbi:lipoprotein insertase outer membrane protein LolB [Marinobacter zhejiangensis]|uniref:Outer-membrane lipoprotein LolB n=1 Tax=Marinobacter zhejiangensis TaxID=488535 RepID=A0A1I4N5T3_9GAMM|nr:lipoprotein insertase outer membrane protein LolB [Marinobacter zhejiangensis]SFM10623.1 outer membrane lipoprotein LolB [Marinobacter zhejiangensis]